MTDRELIKRIAANHLKKAAGGWDPLVDLQDDDDVFYEGRNLPLPGSDSAEVLSDGLKNLAQRLKTAANKKGVMQMREAFALANQLVMLLGTSAQLSDQSAVQNIAKRMMREHKQIVMSLV